MDLAEVDKDWPENIPCMYRMFHIPKNDLNIQFTLKSFFVKVWTIYVEHFQKICLHIEVSHFFWKKHNFL